MATTPMNERALIRAAVVRMRARIMAIVFGLVGGTAVFLATAWLLLQGGENVGQHLGLLGNYMPGYTVTWLGACVGFCWGALYGGVTGFAVAWVYNQVVEARAE
jgi:hypothetical protein